MSKIVAAIGIGIVVVIGIFIMWGVSISNKEVKLRNLSDAQLQVIEANYDKMWKTIQQQAQITEKAKDSFKEIYVPLIEGRYSDGGGQFMKWIQEHNPQFDQTMYTKLMTSVEALREEFFQEQKKMVSIVNEHENLRETLPSSMIVGSRDVIDFKVISSQKSKSVMTTGEENNINVFGD